MTLKTEEMYIQIIVVAQLQREIAQKEKRSNIVREMEETERHPVRKGYARKSVDHIQHVDCH